MHSYTSCDNTNNTAYRQQKPLRKCIMAFEKRVRVLINTPKDRVRS